VTPAALAITAPSLFPAAAQGRLVESAALCAAESVVASPIGYSALLTLIGKIAAIVSPLLPLAIAGNATPPQLASIANGERATKAASALFAALASQGAGADRYIAGRWFLLAHHVHADIALTMREYATGVYTGADWPEASVYADVRILPGAEPTLVELAFDPLVRGEAWNCGALAEALARWVVA